MSFLRKLLGNQTADSASSAATANANRVEPLHVSDSEFEATILNAGQPAIVDFWADWCGPCHYIAPSVEQLASEFQGKAIVAKLNVDDNPETPTTYGIMGIPTLIYFKDGKEVDRVVGVTGYDALASKLRGLTESIN